MVVHACSIGEPTELPKATCTSAWLEQNSPFTVITLYLCLVRAKFSFTVTCLAGGAFGGCTRKIDGSSYLTSRGKFPFTVGCLAGGEGVQAGGASGTVPSCWAGGAFNERYTQGTSGGDFKGGAGGDLEGGARIQTGGQGASGGGDLEGMVRGGGSCGAHLKNTNMVDAVRKGGALVVRSRLYVKGEAFEGVTMRLPLAVEGEAFQIAGGEAGGETGAAFKGNLICPVASI